MRKVSNLLLLVILSLGFGQALLGGRAFIKKIVNNTRFALQVCSEESKNCSETVNSKQTIAWDKPVSWCEKGRMYIKTGDDNKVYWFCQGLGPIGLMYGAPILLPCMYGAFKKCGSKLKGHVLSPDECRKSGKTKNTVDKVVRWKGMQSDFTSYVQCNCDQEAYLEISGTDSTQLSVTIHLNTWRTADVKNKCV